MVSRLQAEIKQSRPFRSREEEVFLNLQRTADALTRAAAEVLKPEGLSGTQYNVLRILRGAGPQGLACGETASRMVTRDPDVTRLLDRLEKRGLIRRSRESRDRRVITTRITSAGLEILKRLDPEVAAVQKRLLGHMNQETLATVSELLERLREKTG